MPVLATEVGRVFREAYGQGVSTLVRVFGDITLAEDAIQEAYVIALDRWPVDGLPLNPAGWIITTARNRAIDQVRRWARGRELVEELRTLGSGADPELSDEDGAVSDDRLRLMFTCCHPSLRTEHQVALTLRLLGGMSVGEIARSFLVTEAAMAKRLVRAKYKIKAANIPYRVPAETDLAGRLHAVLSVLYLIYNTGADDSGRAHLRIEALRLARALVELMPNAPEAAGLLALMLLNESRMSARTAGGGSVVLADQDRTEWDRDLIEEGQEIVQACIRIDRPGLYQLQAAIQAVHCEANSFEATDWQQIVTLYNHLYAVMPTSVVALNRAIAIGEADGPGPALAKLSALAPDLDAYHLFHAAHASTLQRLGRTGEAVAALERAIDLAPTEQDRRLLARRVDEIAGQPDTAIEPAIDGWI